MKYPIWHEITCYIESIRACLSSESFFHLCTDPVILMVSISILLLTISQLKVVDDDLHKDME